MGHDQQTSRAKNVVVELNKKQTMLYITDNAESLGVTFVSICLWVGVWGIFDTVIDWMVIHEKWQVLIYVILTLAASLTFLFISHGAS